MCHNEVGTYARIRDIIPGSYCQHDLGGPPLYATIVSKRKRIFTSTSYNFEHVDFGLETWNDNFHDHLQLLNKQDHNS